MKKALMPIMLLVISRLSAAPVSCENGCLVCTSNPIPQIRCSLGNCSSISGWFCTLPNGSCVAVGSCSDCASLGASAQAYACADAGLHYVVPLPASCQPGTECGRLMPSSDNTGSFVYSCDNS